MDREDRDDILGKRIDKASFFYSMKDVRTINEKFKKGIVALLFGLFIGIIYILYVRFCVSLNADIIIFLLAMGGVYLLIIIGFIGFLLFENIVFIAEICEEGMTIYGKTYIYSGIKDMKFLKYIENGHEFIKFIYTDIEDKILTNNVIYNPKIEAILDKIQETLEYKGISCETVDDDKNLDISNEVEYKAHFRFFSVWRLLSLKEKFHRMKNISVFIILYLIFAIAFFALSFLGDEDTPISEALQPDNIIKNFNFGITFYSVGLVVLLVFLTIHFILSVKKFYARIENNAVYIHNGYGGKGIFSSSNYVLSKIKVNYGYITEGNVEGIMLTIDDGKENMVFKRPKHEKVEHFCSNLSDEVKKRKKL